MSVQPEWIPADAFSVEIVKKYDILVFCLALGDKYYFCSYSLTTAKDIANYILQMVKDNQSVTDEVVPSDLFDNKTVN